MRLGVFGGVFNPPHVGHLILTQEAHDQLDLEQVLFMPVGEPAHRRIDDDPGTAARLEMCELAVAGDARLLLSRLETERPGPSYTVDTLRSLRERSRDDDLFLLIGGDQAAALPSWRDPRSILALAHVAIAERDDWRREEICERLSDLADPDALHFFDMPRLEISSTLVRRRAREGRPIRYLVPDRVASFISVHGLYRSSTAAVGV